MMFLYNYVHYQWRQCLVTLQLLVVNVIAPTRIHVTQRYVKSKRNVDWWANVPKAPSNLQKEHDVIGMWCFWKNPLLKVKPRADMNVETSNPSHRCCLHLCNLQSAMVMLGYPLPISKTLTLSCHWWEDPLLNMTIWNVLIHAHFCCCIFLIRY